MYDVFPAPDKRYVQILDLEFTPENYNTYMEKYVPATKGILEKYGASESVVSTSSPFTIKGLWNPQYLIINFWKSKEDFEKAYCSGEGYGAYLGNIY